MTDHNLLMTIPGLFLGKSEQRLADAVPVHLRDGMRRYVEHGVLPGDFLRAVISNRLWETLTRADEDMDRDQITAVFRWFFQCAPGECFGTAAKMEAWSAKGGMNLYAATHDLTEVKGMGERA